ncbi:uncharacterized protein LOC125237495 [Leguminivora glycinivorella]|uniref:uncharacterized protein LOC125237495 n=1 Tax=Leguminivora glycinivorella TaxID=1035111 RepID=UPI00200D17FF|nr:uncharacterized protein LOC125237495 [Leguminivora glycinivorella]XP_048000565.1 uncharacterized protein LOC125237495 [Leguminivora glycinivorella]
MEAEPSSSTEPDSEINFEFRNNASNIESARFLQRILKKSEEENLITFKPFRDPLDRSHFYTGIDKRNIPVIKITDTKITEVKDIERSVIHDRLVAFYLNSFHLDFSSSMNTPTTKNLFGAMFGKIPKYIDIRTFRKHLAKLGYVWMRITKGYIVMERPSVTFERYHYLKDIIRYREENREIFFVDEIVLTSRCTPYQFKKYNYLQKTAVKANVDLSESVLLKHIYAVSKTGVYAMKALHDFNSSNFAGWIINDLLPILPKNSVVVMQKYEHHDDVVKKPTLYSLKEDMVEWLERNNVPFIEDMSKSDLMSLIESYTTEIDEFSVIEQSLKLKGHELLRLPVCIEDMTPAKHIFELIKRNAHKVRVNINLITESVPQATLEEYDKSIADEEKDTMLIDMKMDEVLDTVIKDYQSMKFKHEDSEVPLSDSD